MIFYEIRKITKIRKNILQFRTFVQNSYFVKITMQLHQLKKKNPNKKAKLVGRGGRRGKTSGRGTKGQRARAGRKLRPEIRDIIKKLPKKRGYRFASIRKSVVVSKEKLATLFKEGEKVTFALIRKRLGLKGGKIVIK